MCGLLEMITNQAPRLNFFKRFLIPVNIQLELSLLNDGVNIGVLTFKTKDKSSFLQNPFYQSRTSSDTVILSQIVLDKNDKSF